MFLTLVAGLTLADAQPLTERLLGPRLLPPHAALLAACAAMTAAALALGAGCASISVVRWTGGCFFFR